jgi:hypothetical protein
MNLYGYVGNDPLNGVDPNGLVKIVNSCSSQNSKCSKAAAALETRNKELTKKINALDDKKEIRLKDGTVITGAQVKEVWNNTTIELSEKPEESYENDGVGSNTVQYDSHGNFASALVEINGNRAYDWVTYAGDAGANMLLLHEIGHDVPAGLRERNRQWDSYYKRVGNVRSWGRSQREWWMVERSANANAKAIARSIDEQVYDLTGLGGG